MTDIKQVFIALVAGLVFGAGLYVSQMVNPAKVLAFLDIAGDWDPSLAFVMAGALAVTALGNTLAKRQPAPLAGDSYRLPAARRIDARLVGGAALFGIGWGLVGICPGPALAALPFGMWQVALFVAAMIAGMATQSFLLPAAGAPARAG